jgi:hypothetical protein
MRTARRWGFIGGRAGMTREWIASEDLHAVSTATGDWPQKQFDRAQ